MDRRRFIQGIMAGLFSAPLRAEAQQAERVRRLGILSPGSRDSSSVTIASALPQSLRAIGYVEGRNLVTEQRFAEGDLERLPELARELIRLQVEMLFAPSPIAVQAAKSATTTVPIVMHLNYSDPVELGFVKSLARPGGNITGVLLAAEPAMASKRLALLEEVVPAARRIAILATDEPYASTQVQWTEKAATSLGVRLLILRVHGLDVAHAFGRMVPERVQALLVIDSTIFAAVRRDIVRLAMTHRLPSMFAWREDAEAGGLIAYGGSASATADRVAAYIDRIFKGAKAADLPVERATKFELVINLKTAKTLGLTIPHSLLLRADAVIE